MVRGTGYKSSQVRAAADPTQNQRLIDRCKCQAALSDSKDISTLQDNLEIEPMCSDKTQFEVTTREPDRNLNECGGI